MKYGALEIKTGYSILNSINDIKKLVSLAKKYEYDALAITDNDNLFGVPLFYNECNKQGIKPIIGLTLTKYNIILYAKNNLGYNNLIKLSTEVSCGNISLDTLIQYKDNLILVMPFSSYNEDIYSIYEDKFIGYNTKTNIDKPSIYINECLYLYKDDYKYLDYAKLIGLGKNLGEIELNIDTNKYLYTKNELDNIYTSSDIKNINYIIDSCNVTIDYYKDLLPIYNDSINSKEYLSTLSHKGLSKRLNNNIPTEYQSRLDMELSVIDKMGFNDYFLIVYDYVLYAKKNNILVGPGRGSAAGSLVSYTLGITDIDPIKYNLLFERFLNSERVTMPDIDIDFDSSRKSEVIEYVTNKYGKDKVAGIITFNTLGAKQVLIDVGKKLKIEDSRINYLNKLIKKDTNLLYNYNNNINFKNIINSSDIMKKLFDIAIHLEGLPKSISMHAAGIVISRRPINDVIPVYMNEDGTYLTGYDKDYLEDIGLLKMDFLSLSNLTLIDNIINDIRKDLNINITFSNIPLDDKKTLELFNNADVDNIFQFESSGIKNILKRFKINSLSDITALTSLYRPGPMDSIDEYIKRKNNNTKIDYFTESLKPVLYDTYGIIVYQEQIMEIAKIIAGYTLGESDILRRAMSKKNEEVLIKEKDRFIKSSINNGYTEELSIKIYDYILKFANYGFNKSHAVAYSIISYKMAFLKTHFLNYFLVNVMNNSKDPTKLNNCINKLKQNNYKIVSPDINISTSEFFIKDNSIICPLTLIKGIDSGIVRTIISNRDYISIFDFLRKNKYLKEVELKSLILSGAFDKFNYNKNTLISNLDNILNYISLCSDDILLEEPLIEEYPEYSKEELVLNEFNIYGFYLTDHPVTKYRTDNISTISLSKFDNKYINIVLEVNNIKEVFTKKNDVMAFIKCSDEFDIVDLTLFPDIYKKYNNIKKYDIINVYGKVEKRFDSYQIIVSTIKIL